MLYRLTSDDDRQVAWHALWVLSVFPTGDLDWLAGRCEQLQERVMNCSHSGCRRLLLALILRLPAEPVFRTDFLDYCFRQMQAPREAHAVRALCMKLLYRLCCPYPELRAEMRLALELMEAECLPPSLACVRKRMWADLYKSDRPMSASVS